MTEAQEKDQAQAGLVRAKELIEADDLKKGFPNRMAIRVLYAGIHYFETGNYTMARFQAIAAEGKLRAK